VPANDCEELSEEICTEELDIGIRKLSEGSNQDAAENLSNAVRWNYSSISAHIHYAAALAALGNTYACEYKESVL